MFTDPLTSVFLCGHLQILNEQRVLLHLPGVLLQLLTQDLDLVVSLLDGLQSIQGQFEDVRNDSELQRAASLVRRGKVIESKKTRCKTRKKKRRRKTGGTGLR